VPWLKGDCYRHAIWMNATDAQNRGIKDGDMVRISNDKGVGGAFRRTLPRACCPGWWSFTMAAGTSLTRTAWTGALHTECFSRRSEESGNRAVGDEPRPGRTRRRRSLREVKWILSARRLHR